MTALRLTPSTVLLACACAVALATPVLFHVHGYGTILLQLVVLGAWGLLAAVSSGAYADHHYWLVMALAVVVNVVLFSVPAVAIVAATARRSPAIAKWAIAAFFAFYLLSLFILFPATDGP
jgi:hypothetical protein